MQGGGAEEIPPRPRGERRDAGGAHAWVYVVPLLAVVVLLWRFGLPLIVDDGYYYLQIASNAALGRGFSFDGIHATNGFHPLWELLLVPIFLLAASKLACAYVAIALQTALFVGSGALLVRSYRRMDEAASYAWLPGVLWLWNSWLLNKGALSGMETGLYVFLIAWTYDLVMRLLKGAASPRAVGIVVMLAVAARIDGVALLVAVTAVMALRRLALGRIVAITVPSFVYLALYFSFNILTVGHPLPISGYRRSFEATAHLAEFFRSGDLSFFSRAAENAASFFTLGHAVPLAVAAALASVGVLVLVWLYRRAGEGARAVILIHALFSAALVAYYLLFYVNALNATTYYWIPVVYGGVLLGSLLVGAVARPRARPALAGFLLAGMGLFSVMYAAETMSTFTFRHPEAELPVAKGVAYLNAHLPPDAVVGSWDAGYVGYYSDRTVINLDGLVNNYELFAYERRGRLDDYIVDQGITHLANANFFIGQKEWIEQTFSSVLLFDDSLHIDKAITRFTVSSDTRRYGSKSTNEFFIYEIRGK